MTASILMLVRISIIDITTNFFVFDAISHVITIFICIFLILSEIADRSPGFLEPYFQDNWPLLALKSGFVTLGIAMILLGISTLGCLNRRDVSQQENDLETAKDAFREKMRYVLWQAAMGAGIVTILFGFVNILMSYLFREAKTGKSPRKVRLHGDVNEKDNVYENNQREFQRPVSGKSFRQTSLFSQPSCPQISQPQPLARSISQFRSASDPPIRRSSSISHPPPKGQRYPVVAQDFNAAGQTNGVPRRDSELSVRDLTYQSEDNSVYSEDDMRDDRSKWPRSISERGEIGKFTESPTDLEHQVSGKSAFMHPAQRSYMRWENK
ncbi:hypothetical protein AJ79_06051 [Helicocarpus griseus UAMH5409]|uniref:DUF7598 domain-containing protein n=1 Tax=Helicocarpus griseus UAMH5409 TaxID=1447875 RepID=A0A2B7XH66_9EURO|nr:hypothetical protein AJ79_06051 [Helicocarpus griseus UAMH5409]